VGVSERVPLPTFEDIFGALSVAEQDATYGPERAQAMRDGVPPLDLIERNELALGGTVITERPVEQLKRR